MSSAMMARHRSQDTDEERVDLGWIETGGDWDLSTYLSMHSPAFHLSTLSDQDGWTTTPRLFTDCIRSSGVTGSSQTKEQVLGSLLRWTQYSPGMSLMVLPYSTTFLQAGGPQHHWLNRWRSAAASVLHDDAATFSVNEALLPVAALNPRAVPFVVDELEGRLARVLEFPLERARESTFIDIEDDTVYARPAVQTRRIKATLRRRPSRGPSVVFDDDLIQDQTVDYPWYETLTGRDVQQGDLLDNCPLVITPTSLVGQDADNNADADESMEMETELIDSVVLSQSCDLAQGKIDTVLLAPVFTLDKFAETNIRFKQEKEKEKLRQGNVIGHHLLHQCDLAGFEKDLLVVDFRRAFSLPLGVVLDHAEGCNERVRLLPPYREHLAQAFARFFMRVGLPLDIPSFVQPRMALAKVRA